MQMLLEIHLFRMFHNVYEWNNLFPEIAEDGIAAFCEEVFSLYSATYCVPAVAGSLLVGRYIYD